MHNTTMTGSERYATEQPCSGCGKPLLLENAWMEDGCPCNTPAGVNNLNLFRWKLLHDLQQKERRELSAAQDTRMREGIEVEKMLCDALGRPWAASGFSIETLIRDIKAELAELKARVKP